MAVDNNTTISVICGPTGSGKTAAAVRLAQKKKIEIVSADSRQIYRWLDIGTAKPSAQEMAAVRFHLVDIIEPGEKYSAARFIDDASRAIERILQNGATPVVVGGTGLYLRALSEGVIEIDEKNGSLREQLEREMETKGPQAMYEELAAIDPSEAARLHPNNRVRVMRALEIFRLSGTTKSELVKTGTYKKCDHDFAYHCLCPEREELYQRINMRVDTMMNQGLLEEVERLVARGLEDAIRLSNVIGYNELIDFLNDGCSLDEAVAAIKQNSRRYAKRQLTWFRHQVEAKQYADEKHLLDALITH